MTIRVLLADDQAMVRNGLRRIIESRSAFAGDALISPSVTLRLLRHLTASAPVGRPNPLTERETEVARAIARGRTNQETADELFISVSTVKGHLSAIQTELDLRNRVEVAAWAWENHLMDGV